jgi:hypothetical protein
MRALIYLTSIIFFDAVHVKMRKDVFFSKFSNVVGHMNM